MTIIGTPETVRVLTSISTQAIDIEGAAKTISLSARLSLPIGVQVDGNISQVNVVINFSPQSISKPLTIPLRTKNLPANLQISSISAQTVDIVVSGGPDLIQNLSADNISLYLDLSSAVSGSNTIDIAGANFALPAGVTLVSFQPTSVTVVLK